LNLYQPFTPLNKTHLRLFPSYAQLLNARIMGCAHYANKHKLNIVKKCWFE